MVNFSSFVLFLSSILFYKIRYGKRARWLPSWIPFHWFQIFENVFLFVFFFSFSLLLYGDIVEILRCALFCHGTSLFDRRYIGIADIVVCIYTTARIEGDTIYNSIVELKNRVW